MPEQGPRYTQSHSLLEPGGTQDKYTWHSLLEPGGAVHHEGRHQVHRDVDAHGPAVRRPQELQEVPHAALAWVQELRTTGTPQGDHRACREGQDQRGPRTMDQGRRSIVLSF